MHDERVSKQSADASHASSSGDGGELESDPESRGDAAPEAAASAARSESVADPTVDLASRAAVLGLAPERLAQQIDFLVEIDRLKTILRQTLLSDGSRAENSAEHSWHLALFAVVLAEHANDSDSLELGRVVLMLLVHDIVEIDAGDTFCYDVDANRDKEEREQAAAARLFGKLPPDQGSRLRQLWEEFEARETPEARFANAVDRLQPMLHNVLTRGHSWRLHGVGKEQVLERNRPVGDGSSELWEFAERFLDQAEDSGWFEEEPAREPSGASATLISEAKR